MDYPLVIRKDGTLRTPGINFGPEGLILVHRGEKALIVRQPGHKCWTGNGMPWRYAPAVLVVLRVLVATPPDDDGVRMRVSEFKEIPTGRRHKAALAEAMKLAAELEAREG